MNTLAEKQNMLYCPKCKREYEDGSQRFCNNDGGRLLPSESKGKKRSGEPKRVFTSLLGRVADKEHRKARSGKRVPASGRRFGKEGFEPPEKSSVFRSERVLSPKISKPKPGAVTSTGTENKSAVPEPKSLRPEFIKPVNPQSGTAPKEKPELEPLVLNVLEDAPASKPSETETSKPLARLIDPRKIEIGSAPLGDRSVEPAGRNAVSSEDPSTLIGQIVQGRYKLLETLETDVGSMAYIASDTVRNNKNVVIRILINGSGKSYEDKIFMEERVSLSHIDHPNVAKVVDSGELPEGKAFVVSGEMRKSTVATLLKNSGARNPNRVARILRQSSYALTEVHQNGILHRDLLPKHILLTVNDEGAEQVKVTDFCVSDGTVDKSNFLYKAPEQIGGQLPTFASDSYALAVIGYQLLTNRLPFEGENAKELLGSEKRGVFAKPSELNQRLSDEVDSVFLRALSYDASKRFPKARDFGDALFDAISGNEEKEQEAETIPVGVDVAEAGAIGLTEDAVTDSPAVSESGESKTDVVSDIRIDSTDAEAVDLEEDSEDGQVTTSRDALWQNRSPEGPSDRGMLYMVLSLAGLLVLILGVVAIWSIFFSTDTVSPNPVASTNNANLNEGEGVDSPSVGSNLPESKIETPPPPRQVQAPPKTIYFENSKLNMNESLASKFRGFSVYYPESWKRKLVDRNGDKVDDKFLDIALTDKNGIPIEQFMVSPYESTGTFKLDTERFPDLVAKSNKDIAGSLEDATYRVVAEGATTIQSGRWKAYEVNFELKAELDGKPFYLWGRRLWIPIQRPGAKTGFILTMLSTSLSEDVKSADDVGKKGDLKQIVQTFEPSQEF